MIPVIIGLGLLLIEGCTDDDSDDDSNASDTWQPKPDAGGMDDDAHGATDRDYYAPDGGVSPDAGPADDIQEPDTEGPQELVDNDSDGVLGCVSESNYTGNQPYSDFKKICDCNDNNKYIKPATAAEYVAQGLVSFDTNCNGTTAVNVNKDAVKFVGESPNDKVGGQNIALGDVNHDGYADVIIAAATHAVGVGNEGKIGIFFGGPDKFKPGQEYNLSQADVILTGGGGWTLGSYVAAVPVGTDDNGDGIVNESDHCDLYASAAGYNNGAGGGDFGDGTGNPDIDGKAAVLYVKGRANWQGHYSFNPSVAGDVNVDGHNAASLTQNQMGIIKTQVNGLNISWGPSFGRHINEGKRDVMLGTAGAHVHLIPAQEYLGLHWVEAVRTTLIQDQNFSAETGALRNHQLADVSGDGVVDMVLANPLNSNSGKDGNGRVTVVAGQLNNIPEQVVLPPSNMPPKDESNIPLPYYTLSGANNGDVVGTGLVVSDLQDLGNMDMSIGAAGQSGTFLRSGCVTTLFADLFQPIFDGADYILNTDLANKGVVLYGDSIDAGLTDTTIPSVASGALMAFRPDGAAHSRVLIGEATNDRFHVSDMSDQNMMSQFQISTGILPTVEGPLSFGSWFSNGADVNGSGAESVLVGAPKAENNKGAAYLFVGVPEMSL